MNKQLLQVMRQYEATLRRFLTDEQEVVLVQAYELGRLAIARGLGVLDMARIHAQAIEQLALPAPEDDRRAALKRAAVFFQESLSPFEATHRGFHETNHRLRQLIATLESRNLELAETNRHLAVEIKEHKRTARALQASEEHYRRLFKEAREMQERLRHLSNHVLHAQEEERRRISRELHDELGQALMTVSVTMAALRRESAGNGAGLNPALDKARRLLETTMQTAHDFARELRPAMLDELGLLSALRSYLKSFADRTGLAVQFGGDAKAEQLDDEKKTVLYRVAQESLANVAKHAHASRVVVTLRKSGDSVRLEIADNGRSFREDSKHASRRKKRLGILGMQERVRLVNGRFTIKPLAGEGTTVRVTVPFNSHRGPKLAKPSRAPKGQRTTFAPRANGESSSRTIV